MITLEGAMNRFFGQMAEKTARLVGTPWAFVTAVIVIIAWAASGPLFGYSNLATRRHTGTPLLRP